MNVNQKILIPLVCVLPFLSKGQDSIAFKVHPYHSDSIAKVFAQNPNLSEYLSLDFTKLYIWVYSDNCKDPEIVADRIKFSFVNSYDSVKKDTSIIIKPDTLTSFKSFLFAYMVYEGAELFNKPRNRNKPLHRVAETDTYDALIFHNKHIDKKGQIWYYVSINGIRYRNNHSTYEIEETPFEVQGWMLKGRTRLVNFGGNGCY